MEAAPGAPAFVKLSAVVQHTMERAYGALVAVMDSAASKNDRERKQLLYEWFVRTRASVIRLLVVLKWARTVPDINHTRDILSFLATEDALFVSTADNLYTLHQRLQLVKVPIYDVPTAIDVLSTGSYIRLPTSIAAVAGPLVLAAPKQVELKRRVEDMLHYRMFFSFTPPQYSDIRIEGDRVVLSVVDEFKASLTADGESLDKHPWRVLDVSVYVGRESDGPVALPPPVLTFVKELLASRLPGAAQPLLELYSILHSFCLSLQLELLSSQTAQMVRGPWQEALWPVYTKDLSLSLFFWTPPPKSGGALADDATYVQVRMDADRALLVSLSPPAPLADPIRLPRPLQAERLLLSAIAAQSLQKLNTLRASLLADAELALKPADASLTTNQSAAGTWHTLVVSLGFDKHFVVGVDGKTGRFVGQMPALADLTTIAPNVNELLNRSPQAAALLIGTLMQQTLLDVFAHLISVYYSSELVRVPSLLVEGYELPARALVHRYTDVEHSFIVIDVNKRGRVACTALTTTPVEGGARPLKKAEELSSELDLRDASLSPHERCRRALASAIAAAQWARASRQVLTRFLEARGVRFSVAAPDRVVLPSLSEAEPFMPRLISFAAVEGLWELRVTEGERLLRRPRIEGGNGMRYHGGIWTFPLARLSLPALDELLKSVRGFGRLLRVAALMEGALDAANNAVLGSQFRGPVVYSTSVQLQHVGSDVESTISISYRDDRYALSFGDTQHPLLAFFQAQLNSPVCDARALLEAIDQSLAPCRLLLAFVQPRERTPSAPVPGDFTLVPHHSSQVRLVYRGVFGVDISFLSGHTVAVEDAVKPAMRVVATTLAPVSQLSTLLERHATKVNNRFVVPWASLPQALHALYRMVGVQLFLRRTQQLLGDVDPPAKADVQTTRCRLSLRSGQALFLYLHDVSQLEVAASVQGVPPSAPVADALTAEEVDALAVFSRTHVACEPFRLSHFASFLHLLLLPTDSLRQFVRLLAAIDRKDLALSLHLALPLPLPAPAHASSAVVADKATGDVRFAVRLHPGTPHEHDAFLRWTPSAARLSSWLPDRALELSVPPGAPLLDQLRALVALPHEARKAALQRQ